jgi:YVTN family beta-propeller protein
MRRSASTILTVGVLIWATGVAAGDLNPDGVSINGKTGPRAVIWERPIAVDIAAFPSASSLSSRAGSMFLSVDYEPEGDMPRDVAFTADGTAAVMPNRDTDNVTFFDIATQTITDTVAVGDFPVHVAVTPNNQYAVVPNVFTNDVSVIDIPTRTLVATIPITGEQPYRVAVTPDSNYAVVGVINDAEHSAFSVIDLSTLSEVLTFPSVPQGVFGLFFTPEAAIFGNIFTQFALTPDGTKIVLPDRGNAQVAIYDRATGTELALLPTANGPTAVDISTDNTLAVISHETSPGAITTIDLTTLSVTNTFSTGDGLSDQIIRITPDKSHAIAAISNNTIFTNLTTGDRTATLYTGAVGDIELSYDGQYAFVSNYNARVIGIDSQSIVKTITFAACAESATSPTELRAVALNNRFRENIHLYNINGSSGFFEGFALSGEPPEGDTPRDLAISADGRLAIVCNNVSRNVCVLDVNARSIRSYVDVGDRPLDAAITPDGAYAVVCAADEGYVRIVDLSTDTVVASLYIYWRPARVRISPDGQYAYVLNVAGTDWISFIRLDGADSVIESQLPAGQTGSIYTFISGIELSHDGATLAVCDSFNDLLRLYDTATQSQVAAVPVGDFPLRVAFSPDDTRAYVGNALGDDVSIVEVNGEDSTLLGSVGPIDYPITVDVDAAGSYVYVGNFSGNTGVRVIDTSTDTIVRTLLFPDGGAPMATYLSATDGMLYAASSASALIRITAAGPASDIFDSTPLTGSPWHMVFDNWLGVAVVSQPSLDGVDIVQFGCAGDLDGDRDIDLTDLARLLANYGTTTGAVYTDGDLDADGNVDLTDLAALLAVYGTTCP